MQKDKDTESPIKSGMTEGAKQIPRFARNDHLEEGVIRHGPVAGRSCRRSSRHICHLVFILFFLCCSGPGWTQDGVPAPFSPDELQHGFFQFDTMPTAPEDVASEPMDYYKNPGLDLSDFTDAAPGGLLRHITLAESFEEDLDLRRGHRYYPIRPTKEFSADALAIHVVFRVFKHYSAYEIIGRLFPENVPGLSGKTFSDEESAYLALEDESGYLKFFPPSQAGWTPGQYRIDIFVGHEANEITRMGTLRFTVTPKA